jgi:hypothetical protein
MACTAEVSFDAMGAAHTHSAARVPLHVQHDCEEVDEEVMFRIMPLATRSVRLRTLLILNCMSP